MKKDKEKLAKDTKDSTLCLHLFYVKLVIKVQHKSKQAYEQHRNAKEESFVKNFLKDREEDQKTWWTKEWRKVIKQRYLKQRRFNGS